MSSDSSNVIDQSTMASGGNTRPQNQDDAARVNRKPQISPAKRWCFTIFKFDENNWKNDIRSMFQRQDKFVVGLEICPKTLNTHLQGFCDFFKKERPLKRFQAKFPGVHFEKTKGSLDENLKYCSKDGNYILQGYTITKPFCAENILECWDREGKDLYGDYITRTEFHDYVYGLCKMKVLKFPTSIARQREVCDVVYQFACCSQTKTIDVETRMLDEMVMTSMNNEWEERQFELVNKQDELEDEE